MPTTQFSSCGVLVREANLIAYVATKEPVLSLTDAGDTLASYLISTRARRSGRSVVNARLEQWNDDGDRTYTYTTGDWNAPQSCYLDIRDHRIRLTTGEFQIVDQWLANNSVKL